MHVAYEEAKKDAGEIGVAVTGSELVGFPLVAILKTLLIQVGLVPLASLLDAAEFYMEKEGLMVLEEDQKVAMVMDVIRKKDPLVHQSLVQFLTLRVPGSPCHQQTWPLHLVAI